MVLRIVLEKFEIDGKEVLICYNCRWKNVEVYVESLGGWYDWMNGLEVWWLKRFDMDEGRVVR